MPIRRKSVPSQVNGGGEHGSEKERNRTSALLGDVRLWQEGDYYRFPPKRRGDPWEESMKRVDLYDDEMSRAWKEDVDTLLVFAGLFSAAVTAFVIDSYKWLGQNDPNVQLLQHLASQLNAEISFQNNTNFLSTGSVIRINTVWFLSLILSLSTVLLGILCKQWLREHRRDTPCSSSKEQLELRQLRFESLEKWGVPVLFASLPLLLQAALVLFFYGILDLLWSLSFIVAAICTAAAVLSVSIPFFTTILPTFYLLKFPSIAKYSDDVHLCPYKSPQAWLFYKLTTGLLLLIFPLEVRFPDWATSDLYLLRSHSENRLHSFFLLRGVRWMVKTFGESMAMANHIFHCFQTLPGDVVASVTQQSPELSRDALYYNFFRYSSWDPDIGKFVAELFLRQVNSPAHNASNAKYTFWNLANMDFIGDGQQPQLPIEFLQQIIASIRCYCSDNRITLFDVDPLMVVCKKLWNHPDPAIRQQSIAIVDDLQAWIARTGEELQRDFIPCFASSITDTIYSEDERAPTSALILTEKGRAFIRFLDQHLAAQDINVDAYSLQEMPPMSWQEGKGKVLRLSGVSADFFDRSSSETHLAVSNRVRSDSLDVSDTHTIT